MESSAYMVAGQEFELKHHGVKGMKWGVRRARKEYADLDRAKGIYKHAKKSYNRSVNYAGSKAKGISLSRAKRAEKDAAWNDVKSHKERLDKTKAQYKTQKKAVHENAPVSAKLERGAKATGRVMAVAGGMYLYDHMYLGGVGAKTAKAAVSKAYNSLMDSTFQYSVLDATGKVLRRYN